MTKVPKTSRLHFIDAMRAWAILMMLQGHFVAALLSEEYRDSSNMLYAIWSYFRGITAPVFFTVSGFIFTYLLVKNYGLGWANLRVKKGIKRGFQLIGIGYVLQIRFFRLFQGNINESYNIVHVLQCLGLSILLIAMLYLMSFKFKKIIFSGLLLVVTVLLFVFNAASQQWDYSFMPEFFSNYFTRENGSVFTIIPWFGFTTFGGLLALYFFQGQTSSKFYRNTILGMIAIGLFLVINSYKTIRDIKEATGFTFLDGALDNSYLFARLGVVLFVFAFFMLLRHFLNRKTILKIGQKTLSIYVLHYIILYGGISGFGLSRFFYHSLSPVTVIVGALVFMTCISVIVIIMEGKSKQWKEFMKRYFKNSIRKHT